MRNFKIEKWKIYCWFKGEKRSCCVDISSLPDYIVNGIDDYLFYKYEADKDEKIALEAGPGELL